MDESWRRPQPAGGAGNSGLLLISIYGKQAEKVCGAMLPMRDLEQRP